jgi:hypothetical protein
MRKLTDGQQLQSIIENIVSRFNTIGNKLFHVTDQDITMLTGLLERHTASEIYTRLYNFSEINKTSRNLEAFRYKDWKDSKETYSFSDNNLQETHRLIKQPVKEEPIADYNQAVTQFAILKNKLSKLDQKQALNTSDMYPNRDLINTQTGAIHE